ncbi:MAG: Nif3-like dinuclear metal center hexameric protein [Lachnospiraceae bacterium]|nr:Nif3-like dinuclear metal center hexameric protein [Lachnospiraceae bacterium]
MKCKEIMAVFEKEWPTAFALDWDNVGLLVGDPEQEIHHIHVALDMTDEVLSEAIAQKADMIVTHHPLLFSGIKQVRQDHFVQRRIRGLIKHDISYYAMHTNFDVAGMANLNAASLSLEFPAVLDPTWCDADGRKEGIGRVGNLPEEMTLEAFAAYVKGELDIPMVRVYGPADSKIERVAISSGSGKSMVDAAIKSGAQVLVTGDIDYHTGLDAVAKGIALVDAGHYGTEYIFIPFMQQTLEELLTDVKVTATGIRQPFQLV